MGFKIFLNITPQVTNWTSDNNQFSLVFEENPFADFVELPDDGRAQDELWYSNILCGVLRGALEMVQMQVEAHFISDVLRGNDTTEMRVSLIRYIDDELPPEDDWTRACVSAWIHARFFVNWVIIRASTRIRCALQLCHIDGVIIALCSILCSFWTHQIATITFRKRVQPNRWFQPTGELMLRISQVRSSGVAIARGFSARRCPSSWDHLVRCALGIN